MQIVVLATHRSGTSTVAGLIHAMGAFVAEEENLMPPTIDNPKGYWERLDVVSLNDRILARQNCAWDRIQGWQPEASAQLNDTGISGIVAELDSHPHWVLKDPRMCLTWDAWAGAIAHPVIVLVHRHPLEIARSLHARDGMAMTAALGLWEAYTLGALQAAAGRPVIHVDYNALIADPIEETRKLHASLAALADIPLAPLDEAAVGAFVSPELNRSQKAALDPAQWLTPHHERLIAMMRGEEGYEPIGLSQASTAAIKEHADREAARERIILLEQRLAGLEQPSGRSDEASGKSLLARWFARG